MPAVIPLIAAGISAYASYKSASKAADASTHASDTQAQSNKEAQEFLKQRLALYDQQMEPFRQFGLSGLGQLSSLLGGGGGGNSGGGGSNTFKPYSAGGGDSSGDSSSGDLIKPQTSRVGEDPREVFLKKDDHGFDSCSYGLSVVPEPLAEKPRPRNLGGRRTIREVLADEGF